MSTISGFTILVVKFGPHNVHSINKNTHTLFTLLFSHLADAFIQSDLQIRKSTKKLKVYKYYIYTFKKMEN